jgi:hypothetical protein
VSINLNIFCASEGSRYAISSPWVRGGWEYATDGRIAVRLPTITADTAEDETGPLLPAFQKFDQYMDAAKCTQPWPDVPYCLHCFGEGQIGCKGCGTDDCEGGCYSKCPLCNGAKSPPGIITASNPHAIEVGQHWVALRYDAKIKSLTAVRFQPVAHNAETPVPVPFVFDGGQGLVMGLRKEVVA